MKLFFLNLGYMELDCNKVVIGTVQSTVDDPEPHTFFRKVSLVCALIVTDDGHKILYDTGCHPDSMNGYWLKTITNRSPLTFTPEQTMEQQLALCGYKPEDIDLVVISHMHLDHTGNIGMFRHARIIVNREEFKEALANVHTFAGDWDYPGGYIQCVKSEADCPVKEFVYVNEREEIAEGVEIIPLPGHTIGLNGLLVRTGNSGKFLLCSDACYTAENFGPPLKYSMVPYDSMKYKDSIEKMRRMQKKEGVRIIFGHDYEQYIGLKLAPEYYD